MGTTKHRGTILKQFTVWTVFCCINYLDFFLLYCYYFNTMGGRKTRPRSWTIEQLKLAAQRSTSNRQVLQKLGLVEAGGNYAQIKKYLKEHSIDTRHFTGPVWNKGMRGLYRSPTVPLEKILMKGVNFQTFQLKKRLFNNKLKMRACELCSWAQMSPDGRIPLELDHINGDRTDNRLENLRILCPNCHSLQPTHRGLNRKKKQCSGGGTGLHATLKMSCPQGMRVRLPPRAQLI